MPQPPIDGRRQQKRLTEAEHKATAHAQMAQLPALLFGSPDPSIPVITGVPTVSGDTGEGDTLTLTPASVTGYPTPVRTWQLLRDDAEAGSPFSGDSYVIVSSDLGTDLKFQQIETNSEGSDTATSDPTAIPGGTSFLLDTYPAAAAYSLRQLRTAHTGAVVRVRRSSDNAEADFTPTEITDGTLLTFCGAGDGFVATWYDQSGSGVSLTQSTALLQPKIVSSGSLITKNSKPAMLMKQTNHGGVYASATWTPRPTVASVFTVFEKGATLNPCPIAGSTTLYAHYAASGQPNVNFSDGSATGAMYFLNGSLIATDGVQTRNEFFTAIPASGLSLTRLTSINFSSANWGSYRIGNVLGISMSNAPNPDYMVEQIIVDNPSAGDIAAIESDINSHYSIY